MNKAQWVVVMSAAALFAILYFGFDTKPEAQKAIESKRALAAASTDISVMLMEAKKDMPGEGLSRVLSYESELNRATSDSARAVLYKELSSLWYSYEKAGIAGFYAEKVAEMESTEEAWSIAGTTYSICVQKEKQEKVRSYCTQHAIQSLENAISLNPSNPQHKINLALVYAENPPPDNPMKGVLMLVDLNKQFPENVPALVQLGRLGIKTSQFDKAVQRLEKALSLDPGNQTAICLLAKAYEGLGDSAKVAEWQAKCETASLK